MKNKEERYGGVLKTAVRKLIECRICYKRRDQIFQCSSGHVMCGQCQSQIVEQMCPFCRKTCSYSQSSVLEELAKIYNDELIILENLSLDTSSLFSTDMVSSFHHFQDKVLKENKKLKEENASLEKKVLAMYRDETEDADYIVDEIMTPTIDALTDMKTFFSEYKILSNGIGLKQMGAINMQPFINALKDKEEARSMCVLLQKRIEEEKWHPFLGSEPILDNLDLEFGELKDLKETFGDEVALAIGKAIVEMHTYNCGELKPIDELWNYREDRLATIDEATKTLLTWIRSKLSG